MLYSYSYGKNGSQLIRLTLWVVGGSIDGQLFEGRQLENIKTGDQTTICSMLECQTKHDI